MIPDMTPETIREKEDASARNLLREFRLELQDMIYKMKDTEDLL